MRETDVVIVGGGIGGSSLGSALAGAGLRVEILERLADFSDRVRGEWIAPWGVAEAKNLGLYELLRDAGGHHLSRHIGYDELAEPATLEELPIGVMHPDAPGPLCLEHVTMQNVLIAHAAANGATVRREVKDVEIHPGPRPEVRFRHGDEDHDVRCRMIVGADGRASAVRRRLGIELHEDPVDHLIAGLLVDGADEWPDDLQATGKAGDIHYLVFPQGGGKIRLYADYDASQRGRFAGADGAQKLLHAFDMDCVPHSRSIASARPIGPCRSFPSQDAWTDRPYAERAVLIGDSAGFNDPIIGQGLSITLRDARLVRDALAATPPEDWGDASMFAGYAEERRERLRRLRAVARFITELFARFDDEAIERRKRAFARISEKPEYLGVLAAAYVGPESMGAELFSEEFFRGAFDP